MRSKFLLLLALSTSPAFAQEDAYLSCSEQTACYVADGCRSNSAGGLSFTLYDGGRHAVIEGLGPEPLSVDASEPNVFRVPAGTNYRVVILSADWSGYTQLLAMPEFQDAGVIVGRCERRNY